MKFTKNQIDEALRFWNTKRMELMLNEATEEVNGEEENQNDAVPVTEPDVDSPVNVTEPDVPGATPSDDTPSEPPSDTPSEPPSDADGADGETIDETDVPMQSEDDFFGKIDDPLNDVPPIEKKAEEKKPDDVPAARTDIDESVFDKLFRKDYAPNTVGAVIKLFKKVFKMEDRIMFTVKPDQKECIIIDVNRNGGKFAMVDLAFGQPE